MEHLKDICPLCKSENKLLPIKGMDQRNYKFCQTCYLINVDRKELLNKQTEKERYLTHQNSIENEGYVNFLNQAITPALDLINKDMIGLDYGCGPGSYSMAAAEIVGESGKVYALDIQPLAVETVKHKAEKKGLENIETIFSDCATGLPDESIDFVILFDIYHELSEPESVLQELHRVLTPEGKLSFSDHHLKEGADQIESEGLFRLSEKKVGKVAIYTFVKN